MSQFVFLYREASTPSPKELEAVRVNDSETAVASI
jgi:hypothetical protein